MGELVQKPILYGERFAGLNREYSGEYLRNIPGNIPSARWRLEAARLGAVYGALAARLAGSRLGLGGLNGSNMARVWLSRRLPLGAWASVQNLQAARVAHRGLRSG